MLRYLIVLFCLILGSAAAADLDPPEYETIPLYSKDDQVTLVADFYPASEPAPVLLLLHMLNSNRAAYDPLIPDLHDAGYAVLNIDMRGHGASGGSREWDSAIADMQSWVDWLDAERHLSEAGLAIIGGSIGANVAIISCAETETCRGAVALSPGLDYRGVKPESALVDGLADRTVLLVAAQNDASSSTAIRQMFRNAKGDVFARLFRGRAHGTRLFDSEYDSVSQLILNWLDETFSPADE
ncbi:MAG: alpha/beta fold hydrolase [Chloroflexi bacterium]|nr:alpha/beta fold hydrolase [Chloroflexota bacterium]